MNDEVSLEWEIARGMEPPKFNELVLRALKRALECPPGSRERHKALRDVADLLAPYWDEKYENSLEEARKKQEEIQNGKGGTIYKKEADEIHQSLWIGALSWVMKRIGLHGEEWVRS